ncbi:MAG: L-threonylcarbamoyladenylate synthase [Phycisphaerae bacterium]|nr:L-threonylcarbamoyladenylate synthase [Phycisphaerae bacterium]
MSDAERPHILPVDPVRPEPERIAIAAQAIRAGQLVAFPTETVYGLGANALDEEAVRAMFAAKDRPPTNPVIVHVADEGGARELAADWPEAASKLAARFWPGPLTLVVNKTRAIPDVVTAGGSTVALRCPNHPVALALLRAAAVPIAAPSANRATMISPTTAAHVLVSLRGRIDFLLSAGPAERGLESAVIDVTVDPPVLLRLGPISPGALRGTLGVAVALPTKQFFEQRPARSPGMSRRHYAPQAILLRATGDGRRDVERLVSGGFRVGWIRIGSSSGQAALPPTVHVIEMPDDATLYGAKLYAALHTLDAMPVDQIVVGEIPSDEDWLAINDRLDRAGAAPQNDDRSDDRRT